VTGRHSRRPRPSRCLRKSGVDDEAIKSGENLLLTFTNVRNVIGDGNDVFDQATKAALDLSVAMGEDLQSSIIRVGKALQDPVKGATALRRVGVLLTQQQQAQIKSLVRQNDVLGAQRIILRELRTEFGGSAAAALGATPIGKVNLLRETISNFSADVVAGTQTGVVPLIDRLQEWFDKDENLIRTQKRVNSSRQRVDRARQRSLARRSTRSTTSRRRSRSTSKTRPGTCSRLVRSRICCSGRSRGTAARSLVCAARPRHCLLFAPHARPRLVCRGH
jgi:hypothetical protein